MLPRRKFARAFLLSSDRPKFLEIVYKAKVTPTQKQILYLDLLDDISHRDIGDQVGLTEGRVNHIIGEAYDKIYSYITKNIFATVL